MLFRASLAVLFLATIGCATATPPQAANSVQKAVETADSRLICRDVSTTGGIGPRHACHTAEQWKKIEALN